MSDERFFQARPLFLSLLNGNPKSTHGKPTGSDHLGSLFWLEASKMAVGFPLELSFKPIHFRMRYLKTHSHFETMELLSGVRGSLRLCVQLAAGTSGDGQVTFQG